MNAPAAGDDLDGASGWRGDGQATAAQQSLVAYCQGFQGASEPWPQHPLANDTTIDWWRQVIADAPSGLLLGDRLVKTLQSVLPQLLLPQVADIRSSELYRRLVLRGEEGTSAALQAVGPEPVWQQIGSLRLWVAAHPCGAMPVLLTPDWSDFCLLVRALAHRCEPVALAHGVHAQAVSGLIHWGLIRRFGPKSRAQLILLHEAPYGSVAAQHVPGMPSKDTWLETSTALRLEHELTHLATKRLLGEMRLNLLDELVADCMGMVAAMGLFNAELFGHCLGLDPNGEPLPGGRWGTYVAELDACDARLALRLVMERAQELQALLQEYPDLLRPESAMQRLHWLCQQRLDQVISGWP
ncbi:hypothetical protein H8F24_09370 [Synechococcus sp. CBW1002]|uniref:DUF7005 family protein n=1 Tax=unclassified Synechococcus TaxID=2626047 RepID=UPI0018CFDC8D|nr:MULTISPECIES: hypothetical protein [unclassified Synechococcus]QPN58456.1 hypothetical protein H8F24_09370 [Synechococcus sp. CBW1002]QPN68065.1 hypothetical protein H8F26_08280 [Synechococcus sp. CBW1006]